MKAEIPVGTPRRMVYASAECKGDEKGQWIQQKQWMKTVYD